MQWKKQKASSIRNISLATWSGLVLVLCLVLCSLGLCGNFHVEDANTVCPVWVNVNVLSERTRIWIDQLANYFKAFFQLESYGYISAYV